MGNGSAEVRRRRAAIAVAVLFPIVSGAVVVAASATFEGAEVVGQPDPQWQTIEYEGVRVEIPASWHRADLSGCELQFEHWTASADDACGNGPGVSFYASATFDPGHGPGLRRGRTGAGTPRWSGWASGGEYDVSVSAVHRGVGVRVLDSVEADRSVR